MDSERLEELLNKYWNCQTSTEEEQRLKDYFHRASIPEQHKETAALFRYFEEEKKKSLADASFDRALREKIQAPVRSRLRTLVFNSMRIAAGIVVLILAVWLVRMEIRKSSPSVPADTYSDPKVAFEETKKALMMISKSFGTAEQHASKIDLFNEARKEIQNEKIEPEL